MFWSSPRSRRVKQLFHGQRDIERLIPVLKNNRLFVNNATALLERVTLEILEIGRVSEPQRAHAPQERNVVTTRLPGLTFVTPVPTRSTIPAPS
jgi:hypothetical protein